MTARPIHALALALALAFTAGCGGSGSNPNRYVALGDSAVAGAGINPGVPGACQRSGSNYPSLLAEQFDVDDFVDVSCPGATTADVLTESTQPNGAEVEAQIASVTPETDVVTISIGGNDSQFIPALFTSCYIPPSNTSAACQAAVTRLPTVLATIRTNIETTLVKIKEQAPTAMVVLVSYLRLMPDSGA